MFRRGLVVVFLAVILIASASAFDVGEIFKKTITGKVTLAEGTYHNADTNRDGKIDLSEHSRIVELFNYRVSTPEGNIRTGEYHVQAGTEDGYASGPGTQTAGQEHHVDYNKNWSIELEELTRVTALYNSRTGTTRTGEYRAYGDTTDGFIPVNRKPLACGILGDLDDDKNITTVDYYLISEITVGLRTGDVARADLNGDGQVTVSDWTLHGRYMNGLNSTFPACSSSSNLNCVARYINGYNVPALVNGESRSVNLTSTISNGVRYASTTFTCSNGVVQASAETADIICNAGYNSVGTQCVANTSISSCIDADGGLNYYVSSRASNASATYEDRCNNDGTLLEASCKMLNFGGYSPLPVPAYDTYPCQFGCSNGACKINNYTANICERYSLEVSDITDTDPMKNTTAIRSRFDYAINTELDINEIEYVGNIPMMLISADEQQGTATIILLSGKFESVTYDKYHNNGATIALSGSTFTFDRDTMDYFTISLGCSDTNVTNCAGHGSNMDACLNTAACGFDQRTNSCINYIPGPSSCIDPDGGNKPEVQAHTFGYRSQYANDRDRRILTGGLDSCISTSQLSEHYCDSLGYITTSIINCATVCSNGACVANTSTQTRPIYILPYDIGIFSYKKDSLEYGKDADMVDYIAAEFANNEFVDGESAKLEITYNSEFDKDAAIAMAAFEKEFTLKDIKNSEIFTKLQNKINDGGNAQIDFVDTGLIINGNDGKRTGNIVFSGRDEYGIIYIWVSNGKYIAFFAEDYRAIGKDDNLLKFLATYLNKYPSTLTGGDNSVECTDSCSYNGKCIPIGTRTNDGKFCSYNAVLGDWVEAGGMCTNNFECSSNVCVSGQCVDAGLIDRILNWFKRLFGGDTQPKNEFPATISEYRRVDSVRVEKDCVDLDENSADNIYNLTGRFCATTKRSQYEKTTSSNRTGVFVSIWDITEGNDLFEKYLSLAGEPATVRSGGTTYTIIRLEEHELLWPIDEDDPKIIFTQEYSASRDSDGTSYSYGRATGDNAVTRFYLDNFPPA